MTKAFDKIKAGLEDAIAYASGDESRGKVTTPTNPTARPWFSAEYGSPRGTAYIRGPNDEQIIGGGRSPSVEDAALIVRAVNAFDPMREALEAAYRKLIAVDLASEGWAETPLIKQVASALAKATGDE